MEKPRNVMGCQAIMLKQEQRKKDVQWEAGVVSAIGWLWVRGLSTEARIAV